jgi:thiamine-phosphate pyrophosphorylase|tara:strand:- start:15 stop:644 length:630 start_codon:yes stop_codon:yes gene_type:complete
MSKEKNLPNKILCLVTDTKIKNRKETLRIIEKAISSGVNMIQLREKHLPSLELLTLGKEIKDITKNKALLIINDRLDIAMTLKCDGVHLGERSIPVELVKNIIGTKFLIGKSIHKINPNLSEYESLINYWILGPIYKTLSHPNINPIGINPISELKKISKIPIIGIGGINQDNSKKIIEKGGTGVAVKRYILKSEKITEDTKIIWKSIT